MPGAIRPSTCSARREPVDGRLVLDGHDRPSVRVAKARCGRIAVDRDHVEPLVLGRLEQPDLSRTRP